MSKIDTTVKKIDSSSQNEMNPENKCSHLYDRDVPKLNNPLVEIFNMQKSLQKRLSEMNRALDYDNASFSLKVDDITTQWRNLTLEFAELLERLPYKEWKTYTNDQLAGKMSKEQMLEIQYEYCDMFHFFINMGLALGIDGDRLEKLYVTKNAENFDRQKRGY